MVLVHGELTPGWSWEGSGGLVLGRSWRPSPGRLEGRFLGGSRKLGPGRVLEAWGVDSVPERLLRVFFVLIFGFCKSSKSPPIFEEPVAVQPPLRVNSKKSRILRNLEPHKGNARPP